MGIGIGAPQAFLAQRLEALAEYAILDTAREPAFDDLTRIAAQVMQVPIALVSFVEENRQWFKSEIGVGCAETPYGSSICGYAIGGSGIFEIEDLTLDARTADNPLVTGEPHARFYAGAVLRTSEGVPLGTICVLDVRPRQLNAAQQETLRALARQTMALLELRRALHLAEKRERHLGHHMATVGHDLRQPLQVIMGSIELSTRHADKPALKRHLADAGLAADRLHAELERLAHAGAAESPVAAVERSPIALDALLQSLAPGWRQQADAKRLRLDVGVAAIEIDSDRRLLASILGNLVGNAIKYTRQGSVSISCRMAGHGGVELSVLDTGIGMSRTERETIFAPFRQVNAESEGLGLGLSLVKKAADYLGYRINVSSSVGVGSRFSVVIPASDVLRAAPADRAA